MGCGKNNADISETPEVADSDVTDIPESEAGNDFGHNASVELISTAAYIYDGVEGSTLYGAIEYKNTGDCPVYLSKISYQFSVNGTQLTHDYTPPLGEHTIVLPGESSYEAIWLPAAYESDADVALTASLFCVESSAPLTTLEVSNLYVADNYPGFSTLSGRVTCVSGNPCSTNLIFVGFYNSSDQFLGAWYLTKNAVLEPNEPKDFVVNMQEFPITKLAEQTSNFKWAAFGFDL